MDKLNFLKEEISSINFNKRIFYAKKAQQYPEIMTFNIFINDYIPYITDYILSKENTEEVLTEYSITFIKFIIFIENQKNEQKSNDETNNNAYNNCISLIIKCFFEKFLNSEDEILKETSLNNLNNLLLDINKYSLVKEDLKQYLEKSIINSEDIDETLCMIYGYLYLLLENDKDKLNIYCNKMKTILKNNNQLKYKRTLTQNIINILPFLKKSLQEDENNKSNVIYFIKELFSTLNDILEDKSLLNNVNNNYLCESIIVYTIKNNTDLILFYDNNKLLSDNDIDKFSNYFITKLEKFVNVDSSYPWRIKAAFIENICRIEKKILAIDNNYFNGSFLNLCKNILQNNYIYTNNTNTNNNNESELKISVLNHFEFYIKELNSFISIFNYIFQKENNIYVRSTLAKTMNKILNNKKFYETFLNYDKDNDNNDNNDKIKGLIQDIFKILKKMQTNEIFEVKYNLLSTIDFSFFNILLKIEKSIDINILVFKNKIKFILGIFETITEWRIRNNIFKKLEKFLLNEQNLQILFSLENDLDKKEIINDIKYLLKLFFCDKANIIRNNSTELVKKLLNIQKNKEIIPNDNLLLSVKDILKMQCSLIMNNSLIILNNSQNRGNINASDIIKNYHMKVFFLDSIKLFFDLYSNEDKMLLKEIIEVIKNDNKYQKNNISNKKIEDESNFILNKINNL